MPCMLDLERDGRLLNQFSSINIVTDGSKVS